MKTIISTFVLGVMSAPAFAESVLEEVVVTSSRTETPLRSVGSAVTLLNQDDIAKIGAHSVAEVLRMQPSVGVSNNGGAGKATSVRIRGEEGFRTLFMMDGVELTDPGAPQMMTRVEHLMVGPEIERIEILRGPQGFAYGADAGGIINIITNTSQQNTGALRVEHGSNNSRNDQAFWSGNHQKLSFFISASNNETDGFNARTIDKSGEADGYQNQTLHGKFGVQLNPNWYSQLVVNDTSSQSEYDGCYDSNFAQVNDCIADFEQRIVKLSADYQGNRTQHHIAVSNTDVNHEDFSDGFQTRYADGGINKIEYIADIALNSQWQWSAGIDSKKESMRDSYTPENERTLQGVFTEVRWQNQERIYTSLGVRYDDAGTFGEFVNGRLSAVFLQPVSNLGEIKYRLTWGTGFRAPSLYEQYFNNSFAPQSDPLTEEHTEGGDVGIGYFHRSGAQFELSYFQQAVRDQIEYVSYTSGYQQREGVSHSEGVEVHTLVPINKIIAVDFNYTYNDTLNVDDQQRLRRPRHLANLALQLTSPANKVQGFVHARAARDAIDINNTVLDDYVVVDANVIFQLSPSAQLNLRCQNLLDEEYVEVTGYNTASRECYAGLKLDF